MTEPAPIIVPRENVNDESATLVAWTVAAGAHVAPGQPVAQIETSKAVVDLLAPARGVLHPRVRAGRRSRSAPCSAGSSPRGPPPCPTLL